MTATNPTPPPAAVLGRFALEAGELTATIPGFPFYLITTHGRVWSQKRNSEIHGGFRSCGGRWLRTGVDSRGYLCVRLSQGGGQQAVTRRVHRLMALAFLGAPPKDKPFVAHIDGNPLNCRIENIRWASPQENSDDMVRHGNSLSGERHPNVKLAVDDVRQIKTMLAQGEAQSSIAARFGVSQGAISAIKQGRCWQNVSILEAA